MNRFLLVFIILVVTSIKGLSQSDGEPSMDYQGTLCAGQSIYIYLKGGNNCLGMSVSGSSSWSFSEPPSSVSYSTDYKSCNATWSTLGTKYVTVSYNCSGGGGSKGINLSFDPQPSVGLSVFNTGTICQGSAVHLSVINALNVGPSPTYDFVVDEKVVYSGSATAFDYSTSDASTAGSHSAYVSVTSSGGNCSAVAKSSTITFAVTSTLSYNVGLMTLNSNCSPGTHPSFTTTIYTNLDHAYTTPTYLWYIDGHKVGGNTDRLTYTVTNSASVYCIVEENANGSHPCLIPQAVSETAVIANIPPSTPTAQISTAKDAYCTGESMTFSATGSNLYGTPHYNWSIDGITISHDPTFTLSATTPTINNGIMLEITDLGGACLTDAVVNASKPIKISATPSVNTILGSNVCSGQTYNLSPTSNVPGASFVWTQTPTNVSGSSNGSGTTISQTLTKINQASSGFVYYAVKADATYVSPSNSEYHCVGTEFSYTVDVNPNPSVPILSSNTFNICGPGKIPLTAQPAADGTDVHWYDSQGTLIPGNPAKPYISSSSTFQTATYNSETQCESSKVQVSALVKNMYTASLNSIITLEPLVDGFTPLSNLTTQSPDSVSQKVQYFDGLGRHYQDVFVRNSPDKNDITQTSVYDAFGREVQEYLPFAGGNNGCPKNDIIDVNGNYIGLAQDFYNNPSSKVAIDDKPYSTTVYESSPLNRVLKKGAGGSIWQPDSQGDEYSTNDKTIKKRYLVNIDSDAILHFIHNASTGALSLTTPSKYYEANQLGVDKTIDEHNNEVISYTDKEGHMVCKKVQYGIDATDNTTRLYASTYYIYNDFGDLVVVLPPEGVKALSSSTN